MKRLRVFLFANLAWKSRCVISLDFFLPFTDFYSLWNPVFKTLNVNRWTSSHAFTWRYDVIPWKLAFRHQTNFAFTFTIFYLFGVWFLLSKPVSNPNRPHFFSINPRLINLFTKFDKIIVFDNLTFFWWHFMSSNLVKHWRINVNFLIIKVIQISRRSFKAKSV